MNTISEGMTGKEATQTGTGADIEVTEVIAIAKVCIIDMKVIGIAGVIITTIKSKFELNFHEESPGS